MGENKGLSAEEVYGALSDQIEYVDHKLDDAMVKIWSPGGSYTFENLPAPSAQTFRFAYEVTDDFTTDARFVEGAGIDYPAGTTVGVINRGTDADPVYMYDVSTGVVLVDPAPTQGSQNAVSSGGTYDALDTLKTAVDAKAGKVSSATAGHFAGLDSNGNLTDSGVSPTEDVTVEGNPVTFDSPFEQDAKSVVVTVKPIQDLHGYDHPWPAGGGKNLWNTDSYLTSVDVASEVVVSKVSENVYHIVGTLTSPQWIQFVTNGYAPLILPSDTYTVSIRDKTTGAYDRRLKFYFNDEFTQHAEYATYTGAISQIRILLENGLAFNEDVTIQIEKGSSVTSFAPYSNNCPISGIDELEIGVSGKNLLSAVSNPFISSSNVRYINLKGAPVKAGENVTISFDASNAGSDNRVYVWVSPLSQIEQGSNVITRYDSDDHTINIINGKNTATFSINNNGYLYVYAGGTIEKSISNVQLELGTTPTEYEPYKGSTTTIPLPSTLYGGDVDVTEGDADSQFRLVEFDDSDVWIASQTNGRYIYTTSDGKLGGEVYGYIENSHYPYGASGDNNVFWCDNAGGSLRIVFNTSFATKADWLSYLRTQNANGTPLQICYPLATPTTLSLTPTDVELLEGTSVVSTNAEKVAVTYKAGILATLGDIDDLNDKVKTKFDKANVATIETRGTASKTYYKGDYIVRSDGCLYDVTATIASGAAFTNSNTHKTNLGDELNKFKVYVATADSPVNGNDVASVSISGYLPISPLQVFSWTGSGTVSITPKSSGGTWSVSGDVSDVRYGQIFMRA